MRHETETETPKRPTTQRRSNGFVFFVSDLQYSVVSPRGVTSPIPHEIVREIKASSPTINTYGATVATSLRAVALIGLGGAAGRLAGLFAAVSRAFFCASAALGPVFTPATVDVIHKATAAGPPHFPIASFKRK